MIFGSFGYSDPLDFFKTAKEPGLKAFVYLSIILIISSFVLFFILKKKSSNEENEISELKEALSEGELSGESADFDEVADSDEVAESDEAAESDEVAESAEADESAESGFGCASSDASLWRLGVHQPQQQS